MPPLSKILQEAETVAGDLFEALPTLGQVIEKLDPHLTAVDKVIALAPRLEAAVEQLEQLAGIAPAAAEPPAPATAAIPEPVKTEPKAEPIQISAAKPEPEAEPETSPEPAAEPAPVEEEPQVMIKVPASTAAALGKTPIQITSPQQ